MESDSTSQPQSTLSSSLPEEIDEGLSLSKEEKNWAIAAHLASVVGWLGVPFGNLIAPFVIWLFKKEDSEFVRSQAIESLNFQISMTIYAFIAVLFAITIIGLIVAIPALIGLILFDIVLTLIGAIRAGEGVSYRYPYTIRLVS